MGSSAFAPRVGVVGARRTRHGLGPFLVRDLVQAGAEVTAFVATSRETAEAALRQLGETPGIEPQAYLDVEAMIAGEQLDAVAILSPSDTHERYLEAALAAGLHVLCEKPFVWGGDGLAERARRLVSAFADAGLLLRENCQWPYTLAAFEKLHPGALDAPPRRFEMSMQPANPGLGRLGDAAPHPLSLLQALAPGRAAVEGIEVSGTADGGPALCVRFVRRTDAAATEVRLELRRSDGFPRRVQFAVDGRTALRVVDDAYRLSFADGDRRVPVDDPLTRLARDFVRDVPPPGRRAAAPATEIAERMEMLDALVSAYRRARACGA